MKTQRNHSNVINKIQKCLKPKVSEISMSLDSNNQQLNQETLQNKKSNDKYTKLRERNAKNAQKYLICKDISLQKNSQDKRQLEDIDQQDYLQNNIWKQQYKENTLYKSQIEQSCSEKNKDQQKMNRDLSQNTSYTNWRKLKNNIEPPHEKMTIQKPSLDQETIKHQSIPQKQRRKKYKSYSSHYLNSMVDNVKKIMAQPARIDATNKQQQMNSRLFKLKQEMMQSLESQTNLLKNKSLQNYTNNQSYNSVINSFRSNNNSMIKVQNQYSHELQNNTKLCSINNIDLKSCQYDESTVIQRFQDKQY